MTATGSASDGALDMPKDPLKGTFEIAPLIVGATAMVALGTFAVRRLLKTDAAAKLATIPGLGLIVTGPAAIFGEAYGY